MLVVRGGLCSTLESPVSVPAFEFVSERVANTEEASERNTTCWTRGIHGAVMTGDFRCLRQLIGDFQDYESAGSEEDADDFDNIDRALRFLRTSGNSFIPKGIGEDETSMFQWRGGISSRLHSLDVYGNNVAKLAVEFNQTDILAYVVMLGVNASVQNMFGQNALHSSAAIGCHRCVEIINEFGRLKPPLYDLEDKDGLTPLHWAAAKDNSAVVYRLAEMKPTISKGEEYGKSPLHFACALGHAQCVEALLQHGADPLAGDNFGRNCLMLSTFRGIAALVRALARVTDDIDKRDVLNNTALSLAAARGDPSIIESLVSLGASFEILNVDGESPVHLAAKHESPAALRGFLAMATEKNFVNSKDVLGFTPLHWSSMLGRDENVRLLLENGADRHLRTDMGETVLHAAASTGSVSTAKILCDFPVAEGTGLSCELLAVSNLGETALHVAVKNGSADFLAFLATAARHEGRVKNESTLVLLANVRDKNGYTPLHHAIVSVQYKAILSLLTDFPVNPLLKSRGGPVACGVNRQCLPSQLGRLTEHSNITFLMYSFLNPHRGVFESEDFSAWGDYKVMYGKGREESRSAENKWMDVYEVEEEDEMEVALPVGAKFEASSWMPCVRSKGKKEIEKWTGSDVSQWLRCIGMALHPCSSEMDCNNAFRRNHVNGKKLLRLATLRNPSGFKRTHDTKRQQEIAGNTNTSAVDQALCADFEKAFDMPTPCKFCDAVQLDLRGGFAEFLFSYFDYNIAMRNFFEIGIHSAFVRRQFLHAVLASFDYRFEYWQYISPCSRAK